MGILKGLKNINAHVDAEEKKFNGEGTSVTWFKIADKQSVTVQFLQELDEDSEKYSEKNGVGFLAVEHQNPRNFKRKIVCTMDDEGRCWACEQHNKNWKAGWKQKTRLYINVLVDNGVDDPFVAVLSQGNGPKSITPVLIELAGDLGSITDKLFKIKRTGAGQTDTSYMLTQKGLTENDPEQYELFDLEKVLRQVPYVEQEASLMGDEPEAEPETREPVAAGAAQEW